MGEDVRGAGGSDSSGGLSETLVATGDSDSVVVREVPSLLGRSVASGEAESERK